MIRERLQRLGLSETSFCDRIGLTPGQFQEMVHDPRGSLERISLGTAKHICRVLDWKMQDLAPDFAPPYSKMVVKSRRALVATAREMAGMTREQLAESSGLKAATIDGLESDSGAIDGLTLAEVLAFARALRIEPCLLL